MPQARVGQRVRVDISGLQAPGLSIGSGVAVTGEITAIDVTHRRITVRLDVSFSGQNTVTVPPERVAESKDESEPFVSRESAGPCSNPRPYQ